MTESSFLYAGDLEAEIKEMAALEEKTENGNTKSSFSVECATFFTIFCC